MAAVDSRPTANHRPSEQDQDQSTSGFTAVNGRSPPSSSWPNSGPRRSTNSSEDHSAPVNGITVPSNGHVTKTEYPSAPQHSRQDSNGSSKRKRTASDDSASSDSSKRRRESQHQVNPEAVTTNGQSTVYGSVLKQQAMSSVDHHWGARSSADDNVPEARLVEALGRESEHTPHHLGSMSDGPPQTYHLDSPHDKQHGPMQANPSTSTPSQALQNKQRKRNFANRTKTGCLTCRERKKKCDEAKPTCNNCARGEFTCKGYSQTNPVVKQPLMGRDHHPIQSKHGMFQPIQTENYPQPAYLAGPPFYPHPETNGHHAPPRHGPTQEEHQRSMNDQNMRMYGRPSWVDPYAPHYPPEAMRHDPTMTPTYTDPARDPKRLPPVPPAPATAPISMPPHMQPPPPPRTQSYTDTTRSSPYSDPRMYVAQAALQHNTVAPSLALEKNEKSKMINGMAFNPMDPGLKAERHTCEALVYNFNKGAADPNTLTEHERSQRFRAILEGKPDHLMKGPEQRELGKGFVGENVEIKAPFYCDYGYNIKIGDNTDIGRNCTITDACTVKIGANCSIGPDVSFYSQETELEPKEPRPLGQKRLAVAKPITIEDDVSIGGKCVILGGVTIAQGAAIGANTVVSRSVTRAMIVVNNSENRYTRGLWGDR